MGPLLDWIFPFLIVCLVLTGIHLLSKVEKARLGNQLSALAMFGAVVVTLLSIDAFSNAQLIIIMLSGMAIGAIIGLVLAIRVNMIQMPELVAILNGVGGLASALVGMTALFIEPKWFGELTAYMAIAIGVITLFGSLIAALKLARKITSAPVAIKGHSTIVTFLLLLMAVTMIVALATPYSPTFFIMILTLFAVGFGVMFAIRVGGADMPVTISLLNSLSGVAGAIAGMAVGNLLLVAIGGVVGASGLMLTQIMCRAMNRSLKDIMLGKTTVKRTETKTKQRLPSSMPIPEDILKNAQKIIIVPGYGMAVSQAQHHLRQLQHLFTERGADVTYAIHPVAGRMPGHMNVLLAEAGVDYDELLEMDTVNPQFKDIDLCIVVGANDVINPAAIHEKNSPIFGMPILNVHEAKHTIICNLDASVGYAGVDNPLYQDPTVHLCFGDAKETLSAMLTLLKTKQVPKADLKATIENAKDVIIIPGYGMAISQAQHLIKRIERAFEAKGANVRYAIHPVAGRMPGHMNVLLAEADVDYDKLLEMEVINPDFKTCDLVIVVGANDVINPAAIHAEGTPIYGMPILHAHEAKNMIICNYDDLPGYAGVDNPLYKEKEGITLLYGDAKETLLTILHSIE